MRCPNCDHDNRLGARFCGRCGASLKEPVAEEPLASNCPVCGALVRPGAGFCSRCGTVLETREESKTPSQSPTRMAPAQPHAASPLPEDIRAQSPSAPSWDVAPSVEGAPPADVSSPSRGPAWPLAIGSVVLFALLSCCFVAALAVVPAFGASLPAPPAIDPARPDLTILVEEAYISDMLDEALPNGISGEAELDVRPGNELVVIASFDLLLFRLEVIVNAGIAVESGQVEVWVKSVETGGRDILELINVDQVTLGRDFTGAIQRGLENELGPGSRLLSITTTDEQVILAARWE